MSSTANAINWSDRKKNNAAMNAIATTNAVEIMVSRRLGHVTLAVSALTCCRKVNGFVFEAIDCLPVLGETHPNRLFLFKTKRSAAPLLAPRTAFVDRYIKTAHLIHKRFFGIRTLLECRTNSARIFIAASSPSFHCKEPAHLQSFYLH